MYVIKNNLFLDRSKDLRNLKMLTNPGNPATRELLSDRYGVALPYIMDKQTDKVVNIMRAQWLAKTGHMVHVQGKVQAVSPLMAVSGIDIPCPEEKQS